MLASAARILNTQMYSDANVKHAGLCCSFPLFRERPLLGIGVLRVPATQRGGHPASHLSSCTVSCGPLCYFAVIVCIPQEARVVSSLWKTSGCPLHLPAVSLVPDASQMHTILVILGGQSVQAVSRIGIATSEVA